MLLLALNSDASIRRLKGEGRPVQGEEDRARLLAALEAVDAVHLFEEDDVEAVLRAIRPHVHAKGGEYTPETVPERMRGGRAARSAEPSLTSRSSRAEPSALGENP